MIINTLAKLMLIGFALFMTVSTAFAGLTVDAAKSQGLVGEKPDGLLGIVTASPSADVQALVNSTNSQRMDKYNGIAAKNAAPVDQIQAVAGQKLIGATPAGEYFMNASGSWQKK
ncbi:MAG TPA: YdbL family protein [Patescibacteria group bacterium]|nr:YdbL family protein [Patescibacteria group bacterium]